MTAPRRYDARAVGDAVDALAAVVRRDAFALLDSEDGPPVDGPEAAARLVAEVARASAKDIVGPASGTARMEVCLVVEIPAGEDAGRRAHELGRRLAEVAERALGATFADVVLVDVVGPGTKEERGRRDCPKCGTALDEHGYCVDAGCENVGKAVSA